MRPLLPALTLALTAAFIPAPAHARVGIHAEKCIELHGPGTHYIDHWCVWVNYSNHPGTHGLTVEQLGSYVEGPDWENGNPPAVSCHVFHVDNDNDVVKWARFQDICDIPGGGVGVRFIPNGGDGINMPDTDSADIIYYGLARFDRQDDPGDKTITLHIHD